MKKVILFLCIIFCFSFIYSEDFPTRENEEIEKKVEVLDSNSNDSDDRKIELQLHSIELPLGLIYGLAKGLDLDFAPGSHSDASLFGFIFYTAFGFILPTEPVYYYKNSNHFFGNSYQLSLQGSFFEDKYDYFVAGLMWNLGFDICFGKDRITAGTKTDFDFIIGYEPVDFFGGISLGVFDGLYYAALNCGFEIRLPYEPLAIITTYTDGNIFDISLRRISAGFRIKF